MAQVAQVTQAPQVSQASQATPVAHCEAENSLAESLQGDKEKNRRKILAIAPRFQIECHADRQAKQAKSARR